ncbi:hypothetical protein OSC52_12570 [Clostridium pasteurianum]|uniref:hypothetical protein n=1 Tax=Clostridium pasteurianum TaxID=1501 RepID=UPI0022608C15|nr:hypothetical protein [Clostridium pasteurianum]UZW12687.1 hypothetical protein OSC52_12570 [Clostridium pasteurianum]
MENILSIVKAEEEVIVYNSPNLKEESSIHTIKVDEEYKVVSESYYNIDINKSVVNILFKPNDNVIGDGLFGFIEEIKKEPQTCKISID